jgi:hypothetical protein
LTPDREDRAPIREGRIVPHKPKGVDKPRFYGLWTTTTSPGPITYAPPAPKLKLPCRFPKSSELPFSGRHLYPGVLLASIAPLSSSKLYNDVVAFKDLAHLETPYVVMLQANAQMGEPQYLWRFDHPNRADIPLDSDR